MKFVLDLVEREGAKNDYYYNGGKHDFSGFKLL
jgi:hypothetical protein